MRHKRTAVWMVALLSASLSLAACTVPTTTSGKLVASSNKSTSGQHASSNNPSSVFPNNLAPSTPGTPTVPVPPTGPSLIANNSAGSGGGGRLIANNTANLTGIVKIPTGLIANNSGSLIANNSGSIIANNSGSMFTGNSNYRVFSNASEQVAPGAIVTLRKADGTYVRDGNGNILTATTDSQGRYNFRYPVNNSENLLVHVYLLDGNQDPKGDALGFVPMGGGGQTRTVDLDTTSSVVMSYILSSYVKQEQTILNRLTAPLEQQTRGVIGAEPTITLPNLTPGAVLTAVNDARANVPVVETQMETVKRALLIGMPNQGQGQNILSVATDAFSSVTTGAFGEVVFVGRGTKRVWMRSTTDTYEPVAGNGIVPITATSKQLPVTSPAPGDGGSATSASFWPTYLAFHKTGALFIADESYRRIRRVDENGIITTYAAFAEWDNMRGLAFEADGSLLVATYSAIYRVAPGGGANSVTLVAGKYRAPFTQTPTMVGGDTFIDIQGLAVDSSGGPNQGMIYVKDYNGTVRKIDAQGAVTAVNLYSPLDVPRTTPIKLSNMGGIAVDRAGQLLVIDSFKTTMFKVNPALGYLVPAAGIGKSGVLGDGGPAGLARLGLPRYVHVDEVGNLFLSDTGLVRKIDAVTGTISTVAGMFRETPAAEQLKDVRMFYPTRMLTTPLGGILFADGFGIRNITVDPANFNNSLVSLVSSDGIPNDGNDTTFAGTGTAATANLMLVGPMTGDAGGNLYYTAVNDEGRQYLLCQDPVGNLTTLAGGNLSQWDGSALTPQAAVGAPLSAYHIYNDMLRLPTGDILYSMVSSANGSAIGASGALCLIKGGVMSPLFQAPTPISAMTLVQEGPDPYLYMGVYGAIIKVNMTPWLAYMADPVNVPMPTISLDPLSPAGFTVVAGLPGTAAWADGGPGVARMGLPSALVVRLESGVPQMYFSDPLESRVRKLNLATGVVSTVAGKNSPNLNQDTVDEGLLTPIGLAFDAAGNLYIADNEHHQIKVLQAGSF